MAALAAYGVEVSNAQGKTLEWYLKNEGEDEFVRAVKDYRELRQVISRQKGFVKGHVKGKRLYTRLASYGAETGRIITSEPNIQGLDKQRPAWRRCIRDVEGKRSILSADLDQIELRILARWSEDEDLTAVFRDGKEDLHTSTAEDATGETGLTKDSPERKIAKRVNYQLAYGARPESIHRELLADGYDVTLESVRALFRAFFERFPQAKAKQDEYGGLHDFDTTSLLGRHRAVSPYPNTVTPSREERLNGPVQSTGADILKIAITRLMADEPPYARFLFSAHDEVVFEVDEGYEEKVSRWVTEVMTSVVREVLGEDLCRGVVEISVGESWGGEEERRK